MSIQRRAIKVSEAARILGCSADAIKQGKAGTETLTLFRRRGCNRLYVWENEVNRLLDDDAIIVEKRAKQAPDQCRRA